jgi:hypothetical protein
VAPQWEARLFLVYWPLLFGLLLGYIATAEGSARLGLAVGPAAAVAMAVVLAMALRLRDRAWPKWNGPN